MTNWKSVAMAGGQSIEEEEAVLVVRFGVEGMKKEGEGSTSGRRRTCAGLVRALQKCFGEVASVSGGNTGGQGLGPGRWKPREARLSKRSEQEALPTIAEGVAGR